MKNSRLLLGGALIGAIIGLIAALLLNRRAEKNESETAITAGEGIQLGVLVFGLLRALSPPGHD